MTKALCSAANAMNTVQGTRFFDAASGRSMMLVESGDWDGWIFYLHHDGRWVSIRKATAEDVVKIKTSQKQSANT